MRISTSLAGTTFRESIDVEIGDIVSLVHEKEDEYDPMAISVLHKGKQIGYIPRMKEGFKIDIQKWWHENQPYYGKITGLGYSADGGNTWNDEKVGKILSVVIMLGEGIEVNNFKDYEKDGKKYARISTVLKKFPQDIEYLFKWGLDNFKSYKEYKDKLNEAAEEGTLMHKQIENFLIAKKNNDEKTKELFEGLPENIRRFFEKLGEFEVLNTEKTVYDEELGTAGTYDTRLLILIKGKKLLLDWKRAKKVQQKHKAQVGFYAHNEDTDIAWVVCFGANNKQGFSISKVDIEKEYKKVELVVKYF